MLELNNVHLRHFLSNDYVHFFSKVFQTINHSFVQKT